MSDSTPNDRPENPTDARGLDTRRTRRLPIHGVFVAIDAPEIADQPWVVDAIDINAGGMGIVLPPELPEGTLVYLSFRLDEGVELARVPARVQHRDGASGGLRFEPWKDDDRLALLEYLVGAFESE